MIQLFEVHCKILQSAARYCIRLSDINMMAGFKNSLKGVGYFIGAACIAASEDWGYFLALGDWPCVRVCACVRVFDAD